MYTHYGHVGAIPTWRLYRLSDTGEAKKIHYHVFVCEFCDGRLHLCGQYIHVIGNVCMFACESCLYSICAIPVSPSTVHNIYFSKVGTLSLLYPKPCTVPILYNVNYCSSCMSECIILCGQDDSRHFIRLYAYLITVGCICRPYIRQ